MARNTQRHPQSSRPTVMTIGYESRSIETYLELLHSNGVTLLCDVRKNPISRKQDFSKKRLQAHCEELGIRYEHLPQLGIDSLERRNLKSPADYELLFQKYRDQTLPQQLEAIQTISAWVAQGERVALTCYELQPSSCHRHCVAKAMQSEHKANLLVNHI